MKHAGGFTLIEVLITVAVVALLTTIALPNYQDYVTRGKFSEAHSTLSSQGVRMEQYFQDNRTYVGACTAGTAAPPMTATPHYTFSCPALTATTFTLRATGADGFIFTLDQNQARATTAVKTGWTANATCWVRKRSGSC
ncbi:MAG: type IV pilin protein [Burkholderiales bacterium]